MNIDQYKVEKIITLGLEEVMQSGSNNLAVLNQYVSKKLSSEFQEDIQSRLLVASVPKPPYREISDEELCTYKAEVFIFNRDQLDLLISRAIEQSLKDTIERIIKERGL